MGSGENAAVDVSVSVRWLVEQRKLGLRIAGGEAGIDRPIVWAHSIELADPVPWLRGGELVLTTGLRLPDSAAQRRRYVQRLHEAGAAALGFGVGLSHARIPPELVEAADEFGLPLLEVPLSTPFLAITKTITDRLAEQEYEGVVRASRAQPRMTRAALRGGAPAVVRELATASDATVLLCDQRGAPLAAHPPETADLLPSLLAEVTATGEETTVTSSGAQGVVAAHTIRVGRRVHGRLLLVAQRPLTSVDHVMLGHAASLIALEQEKPLRLREAQNRLNTLVLSLSLEGKLDEATARRHWRDAGFPADAELVVLVVRGAAPQQAVGAVDRLLSEKDLPCFAVPREDSVIVVVPSATVARSVGERIATELRPSPVSGSARAADLSELATAVRQAETAAGVARTRGAPLVEFDSLAGRTLLENPETRAVLETLAESRLRPLVDSDRRTGTDLVATLRAFLEHNGQWEAASTALGVHRHTLRNRIERIERLLGVDLRSAHVRAELLLSLLARPGEQRR